MTEYFKRELFIHVPQMLFNFIYQMIKIGSILGVFLYCLIYLAPSSFFIKNIELSIEDHVTGDLSPVRLYREPIKDKRVSFDQELRAVNAKSGIRDICKKAGSAIFEVRIDNTWLSNWVDFWKPTICNPKEGVYYVHVVGTYNIFGVKKDINYKSNVFTVKEGG